MDKSSNPTPSKVGIYRRLNSADKEIRLLLIHPGKNDEPIQASVLHTSLGKPDHCPYETVSYCWGDASVRSSIEADGSVMDVPASTAETIRCMRREDSPRTLWIDAVCINQDDVDERGQQVGIMAEIYRMSGGNLVFLGQADAQTGPALDCIRAVHAEIARKTDNMVNFYGQMNGFLTEGNYSEDRVECALNERALCSIFERPWFSRLWVIQEAILSPHSTCFFGGTSDSIDLFSILDVSIWLCFCRSSLPDWFYDTDSLHNVADLWPLANDYSLGQGQRLGRDLVQLLMTSKHRQCTDLKDKVYAILSILAEVDEEDILPETQLLEIDYHKSMSRIYCDATRYAIQELHTLRILQSAVHRTNGPLDLGGNPSWMARLDFPFDEAEDYVALTWNMFQASGSGGTYADNERVAYAGPRVLALEGYSLEDIEKVSIALVSAVWENKQAAARALVSIADMVATIPVEEIMDFWSTRPDFSFTDPMSRQLREALMAGGSLRRATPTLDMKIQFHEFLAKLSAMASSDHDEIERRLSHDDIAWYQFLQDNCMNRRVVVSKSGSIGLAPRCTQPGDEVVVFCGANVPFVLRPLDAVGSTYHLLGDIYREGVMDGEFFDLTEDGKVEPSCFKLV